MKNLFILFWGILTFTECSPVKKSSSPIFQQGVEGYIYEVTGNQMPSPDQHHTPPKPLKTTIFIYEPASLQDVEQINGLPLYSAIRKKLVTTIISDSTGYFKTSLPEGKYSVFVQYKKLFFANTFDAKNTIYPVSVTANKFTGITIKVDADATY
jgi:hypothetical protein